MKCDTAAGNGPPKGKAAAFKHNSKGREERSGRSVVGAAGGVKGGAVNGAGNV